MTTTPAKAALPRLGEVAAGDARVVGRKAARLSDLARAGFSVPEGVVIAAEMLAGRDSRAAADQIVAQLGDGPFAVRSSAFAEDLPGASHAGLYETVLDVTGAGPLAAAIDRCRASAESDRVRAYHQEAGSAATTAVLVQRLVDPDAAGVAFTVDPVSGASDVTVVEAVAGLADGLVAGRAAPQRWRIAHDHVIEAHGPQVLTEPQARSVAEVARRIEALLGGPQDIEWALADDRLWLLQARPVTGLPDGGDTLPRVPIPIEVPPGDWQRFSVHSPLPPCPLGESLYPESSWPRVLAQFGILIDADFATIGGWSYGQIRPVGAPRPRAKSRRSRKRAGQGRPPPRWFLRLLFAVVPAIRRRIRAAEVAVASDLGGQLIDRWYDQWRPQVTAEIAPLVKLDLTTLEDVVLDRHLESVWQASRRWGLVHVQLGVAWSLAMYQLHVACRDLLGWDDGEMLRLVSGLSTASTEPARRLADLARLAARRPQVRALLDDPEAATRARLKDTDPQFAAAFDDYLIRYGARALRYEIIDPTLREDPCLLLRLVRDQLELAFDPAHVDARTSTVRDTAVARARDLLTSQPQADRARFADVLARAQLAHPVREDNEWFTTSVWTALIRYAALEFGRRLVERDQLDDPNDVFMLTIDELRAALQDRSDRRDPVRLRHGQRAWAIAHPGPDRYGQPPAADAGEPPFDLLPPGARLVNEAAMWSVALNGEIGGSDNVAGAPAGGLRGVAASAGRYTGPVAVIMGEHEFAKLRPGDVVVCPVTAPVWSVLYPSMGALVTDFGGVLSHPAIIAREYGLPAVVGTETATSTLHDGDVVTVDGAHGTVRISQSNSQPTAGS